MTAATTGEFPGEHKNLNSICYVAFWNLCVCQLLSAFSLLNFDPAGSDSIMQETTGPFFLWEKNTKIHTPTTRHFPASLSHLFAHYSAVCFVSAAQSRGLKALIEFRRKESRQTMSRPAGKEHRFQLVRNPTHRTRPHTCTMKLLVSSRHRARFGGLSLHQVVRPAAARGLWMNPDGNTIKGCARPKCNVGLHTVY